MNPLPQRMVAKSLGCRIGKAGIFLFLHLSDTRALPEFLTRVPTPIVSQFLLCPGCKRLYAENKFNSLTEGICGMSRIPIGYRPVLNICRLACMQNPLFFFGILWPFEESASNSQLSLIINFTCLLQVGSDSKHVSPGISSYLIQQQTNFTEPYPVDQFVKCMSGV
jgi:hypothetical protein